MSNDLPQHARERLAQMREKKLFTSDLSVSEFLLVKEAGFDPLGLVMGTSIYQVAPNVSRRSGEAIDMTKALYHARELAMNRMEEEAEALGADGIVGVRLEVNLSTDPRRVHWQQYRTWSKWSKQIGFRRPQGVPTAGYFATWDRLAAEQWTRWCTQQGWTTIPLAPWTRLGTTSVALGANVAEFIAIGTAVKHRGERWHNAKGKPFQSDLSGQDFWMLLHAGYRPVGFVMGNCVYYVAPDMLAAPAKTSTELGPYTNALYEARHLAMQRLEHEAQALGATGVVGVTVSENQHAWRTDPWNVGNAALTSGELIELFVIGTAVVPTGQPSQLGEASLVTLANDLPVKQQEHG